MKNKLLVKIKSTTVLTDGSHEETFPLVKKDSRLRGSYGGCKNSSMNGRCYDYSDGSVEHCIYYFSGGPNFVLCSCKKIIKKAK